MISKKTRRWAMLAVCAAAAPAFAQNIAIVNGTPIKKSFVDALVGPIPANQSNSQQVQALRNMLIGREALVQEAVRLGLPSRPDVKAQTTFAQQDILIQALEADFDKRHPPTDSEIRARYEQAVKKLGAASTEYHVHHILVDNEAQARELIAKIRGGANFEALARQYSKDGGSAQNGGDLGWEAVTTFVPEFTAAVTHLQKGQVSAAPVHTQYGWHIIRVDDIRQDSSAIPPLDDSVRAQIAQQIQKEKFAAFAENLRRHAKVE